MVVAVYAVDHRFLQLCNCVGRGGRVRLHCIEKPKHVYHVGVALVSVVSAEVIRGVHCAGDVGHAVAFVHLLRGGVECCQKAVYL